MPPSETQARQNLQQLVDKFHDLKPDQRAEMTEASVVRQFIDRLLEEVLGWPIRDPQRYKYELSTQAGRPDITLIPETAEIIFVEAKRFGVIKELQEAKVQESGVIVPTQMALPGMATDRTPEEQQAINYAFQNNGTWAVLTNFEKLRLFNARRDWLVLSFERPGAYLTEFDQLWQLAYHNVLNGSLDRLSNQRLTRDIDSDYLAFINEWREKLAQDIVHRSDKNPWLRAEGDALNLSRLRAVVQRFLDRLVIARFAEDHLVIPAGTLRQFYDLRRANPYTRPLDEHLDDFFRGFDRDHNSALFAKDLTDEASFSDAVLFPLIEKLYEVRYRSMPADIIGNTYEQYLGKTLIEQNGAVATVDNLETRKKQGSYYTPQVIVRYIVDNSLGRYLYGTANGRPDGEPIGGQTRKTAADLGDLRVLDSACGSGSFLIYAYQLLAEFYEGEIDRLNREAEARRRQLAAEGMTNPLDLQIQLTPYTAEIDRIRDYPRLILETHLYGVDLDPQAAEIAVVNLVMRAMERRQREKRLPLILDQNIKIGNSLVGLRPDDARMNQHRPAIAEIISLRRRLTSDPDRFDEAALNKMHHAKLADRLATIEDPTMHEAMLEFYKRRSILDLSDTHPTYSAVEAKSDALRQKLDSELAEHFTDLDRVRPFHWGLEFPEVFYDENGDPLANPGFTVVFGNPPWEIVKPDLREFYAQFDARIESRLNRKQVEARIAELDAQDPRRPQQWGAQHRLIEQSAAYFRQSTDYTRQGRGDTATHKLFLERMYQCLRAEGRLGYVVPSGIYTDLGTKELRQMLLDEGHIQYIFSFSNERFFFPGVHHSFKFVLLGAQKDVRSDGFWAAFRFNPRVAVSPDDLPAFLADDSNLVYVRRESLERFSPDSLSLMEFQLQKDYDVTEKIYNDRLLLGDDTESPWNVRLNNEFHFTNDRHLLNQRTQGIPFYEGKMIHQYDAFFAEPQFWISDDNIAELPEDKRNQLQTYRVAHRRIARSTDERTLISSIMPPNSACEVNATVALINGNDDESTKLYLCALLNSLTLDYVIRYKISTTLNMFYMYQLPMPRLTAGDPYFDAIVPRAARLTCTRPAFADLWQQVMGSEWPNPPSPSRWGAAGGGDGVPATDPDSRQRLRGDIDAIVAHLYGLTRGEFAHILSTFPLVFPDDDAGRARLDALLATYDAWAGQLPPNR